MSGYTITVEVEAWPEKDSDGGPVGDPGEWLADKILSVVEDELRIDEVWVTVSPLARLNMGDTNK